MSALSPNVILKELASLPKECEWVEFKVNDSRPEDLGEYISALANSASYHQQKYGYLVFGVEDGTHRIVGTKFKPSEAKIGNQELENWLRTQLEPEVDFRIVEFIMEDKPISMIIVPGDINMPICWKGKAYIRIGSYLKNLNDHPEKERRIWEISGDHYFEEQIAKADLTDEEVLNLIDINSFFSLHHLTRLSGTQNIIDKFIECKILIPNGVLYDISNLGAMLFAKDITNFDRLARKAVRVIVYSKNEKHSSSKEEKTGRLGYAVGFEGLINFVMERVPYTEVIEGALRKKEYAFPSIAIRELIANALIHQDFSVRGASPMVEIFPERIEISSPGAPLIDALRFIDHSPQSRNEVLAKMMRDLNICEERGTGIDKVVAECEKFRLPPHETIAGANYTRVILYGTQLQFSKQQRISACYLHSCLRFISGKLMTNESLRARFGIAGRNYPMASRIIAETKEAGLIKDHDPEARANTLTRYIPFWA